MPEVKPRFSDDRSVASSLSRLRRSGSWVAAFFHMGVVAVAARFGLLYLVFAFTIY